jgi:hypothetical protein
MGRLIALVLGGLFFGSLSVLLLFFRDAQQGSLAFEAGKALLQIGVVAVAGAVVSVLIFEYQRDRQVADKNRDDERDEKRRQADIDRNNNEKKLDRERHDNEKLRDLERRSLEYRETLLLSIMSRATASYAKTKKARRLLRGRAIIEVDGQQVVLANQYDICFDLINEAQTDFETIARDVKTSSKAFSDAAKTAKDLNTMDSYLNDFVGEYESMRKAFSGQEACLPLSKLPCLNDFLKPAAESGFKDLMVIPYHDVQYAIRGDLLHPNLVRPPADEKNGG